LCAEDIDSWAEVAGGARQDAAFEGFLFGSQQGIEYAGQDALDDPVVLQSEEEGDGGECENAERTQGNCAEIRIDGVTHEEGAPEEFLHDRHDLGGAG
jgi:hypothetical protein